MDVKNWHPVQLGAFWIVIAAFGLPAWLLLSMLADWLASRYRPQGWFESLPIILAFVVAFAVVALGLTVTWRWMDGRDVGATD